jgi:hypothetical protein
MGRADNDGPSIRSRSSLTMPKSGGEKCRFAVNPSIAMNKINETFATARTIGISLDSSQERPKRDKTREESGGTNGSSHLPQTGSGRGVQ